MFCCTFFFCLCATNTAPDITAYHCQCCVSSRHDIDNTYLETDKVKERERWVQSLNIYIYTKGKNSKKHWNLPRDLAAKFPSEKTGTLNTRAEGEASCDKLAVNHLSHPCFSARSVASVVKSPAQADCLNIQTASLMILQPHWSSCCYSYMTGSLFKISGCKFVSYTYNGKQKLLKTSLSNVIPKRNPSRTLQSKNGRHRELTREAQCSSAIKAWKI